MLKKLFKKYALICYVVHAEKVAYCDTFSSLKKAKKKLDEIVTYNYECEKDCIDDIYEVYFEHEDKYVFIEREVPDGIFRWTFQIVECDEFCWSFLDPLYEWFYDLIDKFKKNNANKNKISRGIKHEDISITRM